MERVPGPSRVSDFPQVLLGSTSFKDPVEAVDTTQWLSQPTQKSIQGSEGRAALLREICPAPNAEAPLSGNARPHIDPSLLARSAPKLSFASQQTRSFHTSLRVPYDSTSYNATDVPDFFVKYKQHPTSSTDLVSSGFAFFFFESLMNNLLFHRKCMNANTRSQD